MTLNLDPERTAILAMDLQNDIVGGTPDGSQIVANIRRVLEAGRRRGLPIVHVAVSFRPDYRDAPAATPLFAMLRENGMLRAGSPGAEIHPEVAPLPDEIVLNKTGVDPFVTTGLDTVLRNARAEALVLMGLWTNWVVEGTARHASDLGYRVLVVRDCCASNTAENHAFALANILPTFATICGMDEVLQSLG